ncbi:MAG: NYN domain-containing protein [Deltaproteobacteria bacterium]|nr:NYN domain-containing protein [Deltaproteobacteria bacterium]
MNILVDGYNLIRQVPALHDYENESLERAREELIKLLASYRKFKRHKITVIFDGVLNLSEFAPGFKQAGIEVAFSPESKTADDIIIETVHRSPLSYLVVSSDQALARKVEHLGASTINSNSFYNKLVQANLMGELDTEESEEKPKRQHKRWETYKKGPARRTPKKSRRKKQIIKKL